MHFLAHLAARLAQGRHRRAAPPDLRGPGHDGLDQSRPGLSPRLARAEFKPDEEGTWLARVARAVSLRPF